jgi:hypothetical protein
MIRPTIISEKYSAAPNFSAIAVSGGQRWRRGTSNRAGKERADGRDRKAAAPARPFLRHLVAVDRGDGGRGFTGHVDEDGGGRAAILRTVIDAGEHDEGGNRVEPIWKVIGKSMAMVAVAPIPGKTPISVPRRKDRGHCEMR